MSGEQVPAEIAKTLVGWKKHFNSYTPQGRFNVTISPMDNFIFYFFEKLILFHQ